MGRRRKGSDQDPTNKDSLAAALARWDTAQNWMRKDPDSAGHNVPPSGAPAAPTTPPSQSPPLPGQPNSHSGWGHNPPPVAAQTDWRPPANDPPIHPSGVWIPEQPPPTQAPPPAPPPPPQTAAPEPPPPVQSWEAPSPPTAPPLADSWDALLAGGPSISYPGEGGNAFQSNTSDDPVEAEFTVDHHVNPVVDQEFSAPNGPIADAPDRAGQQSTSYASTQPASPPAPAVGDISFPPDGSAQVSDEPSANMAFDDAAGVQRPRHSEDAEFVSPNVEQPIVESVISESTNEPVEESPSEKPNPANPIWSPSEESPTSAAPPHEPDISELMPSAPAPPEPTGSPEASAHQPVTETPPQVTHEAPWSPTQPESFDEPHQELPTAPLNPEAPSYFPPQPPPGQQQFYGWTPPSGQTPPPVDYQQNYQQQQQPSQQFYPGPPQYFQPPAPQAPPAQQFSAPPPQHPQPAPSQPQQPQQAPNPTEAAHPQSGPAAAAPGVDDLTSQALLRARNRQPQGGWRKAVYTLSAHTVNPGEAASDVERRELMQRAMASVQGCYRIAVISLKGGVGKTTMTVCLGATLASLRGDRVIAVDANPDRGTLSGKIPLETVATVRNLLNDANDIDRYSDVRRYTSQSPDRLEVLASESDPAVSIAFSEDDYRVVAGILERFYNVVLTDCGTGLLHSAMSGVLALANQLIVVSSGSVDGARSASATLDWLEAHGHSSLVAGSVAVINSVRPKSGGVDLDRLEEHFASRCRAVTRIPYDPHLEEGAEVDLAELKETTRLALLGLAAQVADGFPARSQTTRAPIHQSMGGLG